MTRSSNTKVFTPFANPERQFRNSKDITPITVHNIYSFYESKLSESESEDFSDIDIDTLTLEQYLALNRNNSQMGIKRLEIKKNAVFEIKSQLLKELLSNALADLGANISVMPFSMFKRLGLGNPRPVNMVIEMANRSMQSPKGIVENVLVKIHKFIFLVDFVILDIVEDNKVPIILGRHMLATAHARIDVFGGKISLEVGKE
ncbi:putative reverse transcriptase, RNA-dependent DNA polymerase [Tanacetum coccineum]